MIFSSGAVARYSRSCGGTILLRERRRNRQRKAELGGASGRLERKAYNIFGETE